MSAENPWRLGSSPTTSGNVLSKPVQHKMRQPSPAGSAELSDDALARVGLRYWVASIFSAADGSESLRNLVIRSTSSVSPIAPAARPSAYSARKNPRLGSWLHGIGPAPFQPAPRSESRPRWYPTRA